MTDRQETITDAGEEQVDPGRIWYSSLSRRERRTF